MKDRVRETLFDLVGRAVEGAIALDLFAGTGALGFEALSRGAAQAVFVERHFPTVDALRRSARELGVADRSDIRAGDVLVWARRLPPLPTSAPWLVFVSPPWPLFADRSPDLVALVTVLLAAAPAGSVVVVESDAGWDPTVLPDPASWEQRGLPPAILHVRRGLVS